MSKMVDLIVNRVTRSVALQVTRDIAPVVTVAIENALVRRGKPAARYEADALAAVATTFIDALNKTRGKNKVNDKYIYALGMHELSLYRQLQQAIDAYKEKLRNGEN